MTEIEFNRANNWEPTKPIMIPKEQQQNEEPDLWDSILETYRQIKAAKPDERSERARRFAVLLTEYEKVISYYLIMLSNDDFVG